MQSNFRSYVSFWRFSASSQYPCGKFAAPAGVAFRATQPLKYLTLFALFVFLTATAFHAQVTVDATTSANAEFTGAGTFNLSFNHTTTATANRLLVVGLSMNIRNSTGSTVTGVTYNGTPLTLIGAHNDTGNTRRVEQWYLLSPASGTNLPVVVSVNVPTAAVKVGVVAGATTLTGVDQTVPLGTFVSADGAAAGFGQLNPFSVINGMIIDTMAVGGNVTATPYGPQVQQWNATTVSGTDPPAVTGFGSSRTGAPSVPLAGTFSANSNWSYAAIPINPSTADIAVSTSVSAVALGQNSTYKITITNNGPSAANSVTLTDTYNNANLSLVSYTPSAGTTCTNTATTINCNLPTPFASGATATVSVVVSTTQAGFYPNTALVSDSGTPPDPNTGNNTYVALAPVVSVVCAANTLSGGGTLTGTINSYWPGNGSVVAGATSIPLGTENGAGTIAAGSLLLVIQMQDASINTSNSVQYGNGSTGQGFTAINNSGNYEFVTATGPVAGGSVPIRGAGASSGLVFGYTSAVATTTKGISTYQVVLVPQYTSATLGALTAAQWNGTSGGIIALDVAGQLNLGGGTAVVDGRGFRGGAGMQLTGNGAGANTDYQFPGPANYGGAAIAGVDAPKGEGVAGTSKFVEYNSTYLRTINGIGYPSGGAADGSMAHGAPGNAGGGGTDSDSANNDQNAGGGGGANGGGGGFGGDSWNTNLSSGGEGGSPFPATIDRIAMGGGGGAGTRNNSDGDNLASSGSSGGGLIFIRADSLTGTATLTANGANAYNGTANDAGGGGGAGGTIVILTANGGESGLTLQANGGNGGNAWSTDPYSLADRHGPGGGGGGGVIFVSGTPASTSVTGGSSGSTLNPGVPYGSTAGTSGTPVTNATLGQVTGIQSSSLCTPDLAISKTHVGIFTRGSAASYTIIVSNVSPYGATTGLVTMDDTLPLGISPTSASGTGWSCSISGQTVSCTRSDALTAGVSYPAITVNALVAQSAPATLINVAAISGGGEANLINDTATDVASVVSSADMSVTLAASPNPVASGTNITYTIVAADNGPSAADNATMVMAVPANTTFVSFTTPAGWSCQLPIPGNAGNVVCTDISLPGVTSSSFTMVVKVNSGVTNGTQISGTTTVSSSVIDPIISNNTATVSTLVGGAGPNLSVTNSASPNPVQAGNNITYTQVVTNTGSSAVTNGTFTEATPANTTFVSITPPAGWSCAGFPGSPCTATTVAAGTSGTFTVVYNVNGGTAAGTVISDTATVNASNQSFGTSSAAATDVVGTATQADVSLTTAGAPNPVLAGNSITYTQTVTSNGPAAATGVNFSEATPPNTTFDSVLAPAGWACTTPAVGSTGTISCTDSSSLASGTSADIVVVVDVSTTAPSGNTTATSAVSATTSDPNATNNTTTTAVYVQVKCDLAVTNSGTPSPVLAGNNITYTQVVTNNGPSNCSTATVTEPTPTNTTFVSVAVVTAGGGTWTCPNTAPISCTNPSVPPDSTGTITAIYKVNAGTAAGTIIADTVTGATTSGDSSSSNNTATVNIAVTSGTQADLSIASSGSPNPVTAGNNITYTQTVTNAGPASATTPKVVETLPPGTTAVSLTGPAGWTCTLATLTCTDGANLAANTTTTAFTLVASVPTTTASGTALNETGTVSSTTSDSNSGNNSSTVTTYVSTSADLSVTNTAAPVPVRAGNNITYTQVVTNSGPSTATSVSLTETLPASTTVVSLTGPAGWTCTVATRTCTNPSMAPGTASFSYVLTVTAGTAAGTAVNETASVSSSITDPNSANNTATAADVVALATQADLVVTDSATPTLVTAGSNVTYTQTVKNLGPAAATVVSYTQVTPPNTNFRSITPPAGWTCGTVPAVGGTGTITCTDGGTLAVNATATFTLVLQVNSGTPTNTSITDTETATASNIVPGIATNTASATVVVVDPNSADMAIVKTATPNPVTEGTPLLYTLTVTNNGPSTATTVTVTDNLPSTVTYLASTTTQGTCSEANSVVTCLLGTMANAGTATISILTIPGTPGIITNTATVDADQADSNLNNNTSSVNVTVLQPTSITLRSFSANYGTDKTGARRVVLTWTTGGEAHNLGFNVYRDLNGMKVRMNPGLIAGAALTMHGALPRHAGRTYGWIDSSAPKSGTWYWLEDVDVNGTRTMHGPVAASGGQNIGDVAPSEAKTLSQVAQSEPAASEDQKSHPIEPHASSLKVTQTQIEKQFEIASHPAVKILVSHEGWYTVPQPELIQAGLNASVDPAMLHLYAQGIEIPIQITGASQGPGGFGTGAAINFYGTGINTPFSGTRVFWLAAEGQPGLRIPQLRLSHGSNLPLASYWATVELQQHLIYFSSLITTNGQNFFGALVSTTPVDQVLDVPNLDMSSTQVPQLEIALQGVITAYPHDVEVALNGTNLGNIIFTGQDQGTLKIAIPTGLLQTGSNTVTLTGQNGEYDTSLVEYIRISYPHLYVADLNQLKFTGRGGDEIAIANFDSVPVIVDVTDPVHPVQVTPQTESKNGKYGIAIQVPFTAGRGAPTIRHTLIASGSTHTLPQLAVVPNHPSNWHGTQRGADIVMVTYGEFAAALTPLVQAHQNEGKTVAVVPVSDLYDEFNFGEGDPVAIRRFLQVAGHNWKQRPTYLLLNGRASLDPRNYLGFGSLDYVPTQIVATGTLMTASDDWFSDFTDSGMPTIATGRLPVSTPQEAQTVVNKIVGYEGEATNGPWTANALFVADRDDSSDNFTQDTQTVQQSLPATVQATQVFVDNVGVAGARTAIVNAINSGQLLVNYLGHGSEEQWSGSNIFDETTANSLTNGSQLPVFLIMDCLNGFFQDVYAEPLGVTLELAPNGGAVAVVASSGLNQAPPQASMNAAIVQNAVNGMTLGNALLKAKALINDPDVQRTYNLLGDPAMHVKKPAGAH